MKKEIKRPLLITLVCILGFIWSVVGFPSIFSPFVKKKGLWFPALSGLITALEFVAEVGVWYMKKWGVFLYLISALMAQIVALWIDNWSITHTIIQALFLLGSVFFVKRMDNNL